VALLWLGLVRLMAGRVRALTRRRSIFTDLLTGTAGADTGVPPSSSLYKDIMSSLLRTTHWCHRYTKYHHQSITLGLSLLHTVSPYSSEHLTESEREQATTRSHLKFRMHHSSLLQHTIKSHFTQYSSFLLSSDPTSHQPKITPSSAARSSTNSNHNHQHP
jgi:hypothetical protein